MCPDYWLLNKQHDLMLKLQSAILQSDTENGIHGKIHYKLFIIYSA